MELFKSKLETRAYDEFANSNFRTSPSLEDYKLLIKILQRSYFIRDKNTHEIIPCFSFFHRED